MTEVTLDFISRQLERVLAEQAAMRDEMLVFGARLTHVDTGIEVVIAEVRALTRAVARLNDRVTKLEEPAA